MNAETLSGESESWWLSGVEEIFGSSMTAATSSVLQSELDNCQELLQMEPDNKCEYMYMYNHTCMHAQCHVCTCACTCILLCSYTRFSIAIEATQ